MGKYFTVRLKIEINREILLSCMLHVLDNILDFIGKIKLSILAHLLKHDGNLTYHSFESCTKDTVSFSSIKIQGVFNGKQQMGDR